jgi:hypothetical protein
VKRSLISRPQLIAMFCGVTSVVISVVLPQEFGPGTFDLSWNTIDGGGGSSAGGTFEMQGTIGQPDAGVVALSGGSFEVIGGYWPGSTQFQATCPADVTLPPNGVVNIDDLIVVITHWGQAGGQGDVNHDNTVDIDDLLQVIVHWGMCP